MGEGGLGGGDIKQWEAVKAAEEVIARTKPKEEFDNIADATVEANRRTDAYRRFGQPDTFFPRKIKAGTKHMGISFSNDKYIVDSYAPPGLAETKFNQQRTGSPALPSFGPEGEQMPEQDARAMRNKVLAELAKDPRFSKYLSNPQEDLPAPESAPASRPSPAPASIPITPGPYTPDMTLENFNKFYPQGWRDTGLRKKLRSLMMNPQALQSQGNE